LARATEGFTGSEIETALVDALHLAFSGGNEPGDLTVARVLNDCVPLSKLTAEQIEGLRKMVQGSMQNATSQQEPASKLRKLVA